MKRLLLAVLAAQLLLSVERVNGKAQPHENQTPDSHGKYKWEVCPRKCHCYKENNVLSKIDCHGFKGGAVPPAGKASRIKTLILRSCWIVEYKLTHLRSYIHLQTLDLRHNELNNMPGYTFNQLHQLRNLNLYNASITNLKRNIFQQLKSLEHLNLRQNDISKLHDDLFENQVNLRTLDLSKNDIFRLEKAVFRNLFRLEKLQLQENDILNIHVDTLKSLESLVLLNLSHNDIRNLPIGLFDKLGSLRKLDLGGRQLFRLDYHLCAVEKFVKMSHGQVSLTISKDVADYLKNDKPCEQDCSYLWRCPPHHKCIGPILDHKCVAMETRERL